MLARNAISFDSVTLYIELNLDSDRVMSDGCCLGECLRLEMLGWAMSCLAVTSFIETTVSP